MSLPPDLVEMLSVFAAHQVRYLVIGGHAVSLHARPRTTKDLDLLLDPAPENIARTCAALTQFGVPAELVTELRSAALKEIVWIGRVPARVDFLQHAPGVVFDEAWPRRVTLEIGGTEISFIGPDDLMANKRAVGRPQDLRDLRALERAKAGDAQRPKALPKKRRRS